MCTSSATLGMTLLQYPLFFAFLQPKDQSSSTKPSQTQTKISGPPLSHFWSSFLAPASTLIAGVALTSATSGFFATRWLRSHARLETTAVSKWYAYGAMLALGHLAFVPMVAGPIVKITDALKGSESEDEVVEANEGALRAWLSWHTVRTVLVDVPALWCFAEGAARSFWVI